MRYFLDNQDDVWALDENGNEYLVTADRLIPAKKGSIDLYWGGIDESEGQQYI